MHVIKTRKNHEMYDKWPIDCQSMTGAVASIVVLYAVFDSKLMT